MVREAKGGKDRVVMLPRSLHEALKAQVGRARAIWTHDREVGAAGVEVPDALAVKYPDLGRRWAWFWVFPAPRLSVDPRSRIERRRHSKSAGRATRLIRYKFNSWPRIIPLGWSRI